MSQRTRWMKGWMQTFIVHNRNPRAFLRDIGWRGFLAFQVFVGGLILSPLLHTVFVATVVIQLTFGVPWSDVRADAWMALHLAILAVGYGGALAVTFAGLIRLGQLRLLAPQLLLPAYWLLHAVATLRAAHELLVCPFFWAKTEHGRTRIVREVTRPVAEQADNARKPRTKRLERVKGIEPSS